MSKKAKCFKCSFEMVVLNYAPKACPVCGCDQSQQALDQMKAQSKATEIVGEAILNPEFDKQGGKSAIIDPVTRDQSGAIILEGS